MDGSVGVGNVIRVQDAVLVLQRIALGEVAADELGVVGAVNHGCATWMPLGHSSRATGGVASADDQRHFFVRIHVGLLENGFRKWGLCD